MTGHAANPDAEVTLTEAERKMLRDIPFGFDYARRVDTAVKSIVAARLAPVEAERDEWRGVATKFSDDFHAEVDKRIDAEQQAADLRAELDGLRAGIEALADEYTTAIRAHLREGPHDRESRFAENVVRDLRALLDNPGTALDAVRAEAKAEARRVEPVQCYSCGHQFGADLLNRIDTKCPKCGSDSFTRADALTDNTGGGSDE